MVQKVQIEMVNLKGFIPKGVVRVDRGHSVLANPFKMKNKSESERNRVIALYRRWLWCRIQKRDSKVCAELGRLKRIAMKGSLVLGCWCAPERCHAEIIGDCLVWAISKQQKN